MDSERPKWQVFLMTYAVAFVVSTVFGLLAGDPVGEALAGGLVRALLFGTVMALVLIGMMKANRTYADHEAKHATADEHRSDHH